MCAGKEPVRTKVDRLIEAMDRWTFALQKTDQRSCNPESNEKSVYTRCGYPATLAAELFAAVHESTEASGTEPRHVAGSPQRNRSQGDRSSLP
jgi:hypothetical protein